MNATREGYDATIRMTAELVEHAKIFGSMPVSFAFPPREIGLIASVADVGEKLARNDAARALVRTLIEETKRRRLADYPTVMMLRAALDFHGIPVLELPLDELGLGLALLPRGDTREGNA